MFLFRSFLRCFSANLVLSIVTLMPVPGLGTCSGRGRVVGASAPTRLWCTSLRFCGERAGRRRRDQWQKCGERHHCLGTTAELEILGGWKKAAGNLQEFLDWSFAKSGVEPEPIIQTAHMHKKPEIF